MIGAWFGRIPDTASEVMEAGLRPCSRTRGLQKQPARSLVGKGFCLGHHLRPITPESYSEQQPLVSSCTRYAVCADLRLDNRQQLLHDLHISASNGITTDPDILVMAFAVWGEGCFQRLKGDFAVIIVDTLKQCAFVAVDYAGNKSLYWRKNGDQLLVNSQMLGILPEHPTLDDEVLCRMFFRSGSLRSAKDSATLYSGVQQVPAGSFMKIDLSASNEERQEGPSVSIHHYWRAASLSKISLKPKDWPEIVSEFQRLFEQAVTRRLRTLEPVACHLSGGFDSSSVAAVAAREYAKQGRLINCYTHTLETYPDLRLNFSHRSVHELGYAQAVQQRYPNIRLHAVTGRRYSVLKILDYQIKHAASYGLNFDNLCYISEVAENAAQQGASVILTGARGNLAFSYGGKPSPNSLKTWLRTWLPPRNAANDYLHVRQQIATKAFAQSFCSIHQLTDVTPNVIASFFKRTLFDEAAFFKNWLDIEHWDPTTDIDLTTFVWSLPEWAFYHKGESRRLVRAASEAWLPDLIRLRKDRGLQSGDALMHFQQHLDNIRVTLAGLSNEDRFIQLNQVMHFVDELSRAPANTLQLSDLSKISGVYSAIGLHKLDEFVKNYKNLQMH